METRKRFPKEVRERAVRLVFEQQPNHSSQWAAIESIAEKIACKADSLRRSGCTSRTSSAPSSRCSPQPGARAAARYSSAPTSSAALPPEYAALFAAAEPRVLALP